MDRKKLIESLSRLMPGLAKGDIVEHFSCFNIEGDTIRVTNGRLFMREKLEENLGFRASVPGKIFYQFLTSVKQDTIQVTPSEGSLTLNCGKVDGKLLVKKLETAQKIFEAIEEPADSEWKPLPAGFVLGLKLCKFSCSDDLTIPVLTGVFVNGPLMFSCDRYRITKYECEADTEMKCILPVSLIQELEKNSSHVDAYCIKNGMIFFRLWEGKVVLGSGLIDGSYPDLSSHFPELTGDEIVELPVELSEALDRQNLIQSEVMEIDRETEVVFSGKKISLHAKNKDVGEISEEIDFETPPQYKSVKIRMNPVFFREVLDISRVMAYDKESNSIVIVGDRLTHLVKTKVS